MTWCHALSLPIVESHGVVHSMLTEDELIEKILADPSLLSMVSKLVKKGRMRASTESLRRHPWNLLVALGLANVENRSISLESMRWRVTPTEIAVVVHQTYIIQTALKNPFGGQRL